MPKRKRIKSNKSNLRRLKSLRKEVKSLRKRNEEENEIKRLKRERFKLKNPVLTRISENTFRGLSEFSKFIENERRRSLSRKNRRTR